MIVWPIFLDIHLLLTVWFILVNTPYWCFYESSLFMSLDKTPPSFSTNRNCPNFSVMTVNYIICQYYTDHKYTVLNHSRTRQILFHSRFDDLRSYCERLRVVLVWTILFRPVKLKHSILPTNQVNILIAF